MTTQISTKLSALAIALVMNGLLIGSVAYVFNTQIDHGTTATSLEHAALPAQV